MDSWTVFSLAFAGVLISAWLGRKNSPDWYLGGIVPLLYGGVALRIILFGALLPAGLLGWLWWDRRRESSDPPDEP